MDCEFTDRKKSAELISSDVDDIRQQTIICVAGGEIENGSDPSKNESVGKVSNDESAGLPGVQADKAIVQTEERRPIKGWSVVGAVCACGVIIAGQLFMVAGGAISAGTFASISGGVSFERVMYHCGPQDSYAGLLAFFAIFVFWYAWYIRNRLAGRVSLLISAASALFIFSSFARDVAGGLVAIITFGILALFQVAGRYFAARKRNWPYRFSVTRWLAVCYIPAALLLGYEFSNLAPTGTHQHISAESTWSCAAIIAAFSFLPAFLTALDCRSRQFASGFGLAAIGQAPVLLMLLIYSLTNVFVLAWVSIAGISNVADYYAFQSQFGLEPDLDHQTTLTEITLKCLFSIGVWCTVFASVVLGSALGILYNRRRGGDRSRIKLRDL